MLKVPKLKIYKKQLNLKITYQKINDTFDIKNTQIKDRKGTNLNLKISHEKLEVLN